jgi:hypothetical protein
MGEGANRWWTIRFHFLLQLPAHHAGGGLRNYLGGLEKSAHEVVGFSCVPAHDPLVFAGSHAEYDAGGGAAGIAGLGVCVFEGGIFVKVGILAAAFLLTEGWMRFVIKTLSGSGLDISRVVQQIGLGGVVETVEQSEAKHAGLNMLEELAWINSFLDKGTYAVNWGPVK